MFFITYYQKYVFFPELELRDCTIIPDNNFNEIIGSDMEQDVNGNEACDSKSQLLCKRETEPENTQLKGKNVLLHKNVSYLLLIMFFIFFRTQFNRKCKSKLC